MCDYNALRQGLAGGQMPQQLAMAGDRWTDPQTGATYQSMGPESKMSPGARQEMQDWQRSLPDVPIAPGGPPMQYKLMAPEPGRGILMPGAPKGGIEQPEIWRRLPIEFPTS